MIADIIYIGAIHTQHAPLSRLFLNSGHNVLCEKPMAMNEREAAEIMQLAKSKNLFFMEVSNPFFIEINRF